MLSLNWPEEVIPDSNQVCGRWLHAGSNLCLDFHGDPCNAELVVFSDGNHHMALLEALSEYRHDAGIARVFYVTTPPAVLLQMLDGDGLCLGNLRLRVQPHVFISPPKVLQGLVQQGKMRHHLPFMRSQGSVLLLRKGNPKGIRGLADLQRKEICLFLSNPNTETVSYQGYVDTLKGLAHKHALHFPQLDDPTADNICYGECIHHREAPQAVAEGRADVALLYYHLALRYIRIFPELFEMLPLGGTVDAPIPEAENIISHINVGVFADGGTWGQGLVDFLLQDKVRHIYQTHGLIPLQSP